MKKLLIWLSVFLIICISVFSCVPCTANAGWKTYDDGYEDGYREGYDEGYSAGYEYGLDEGWGDGTSEGYNTRIQHEQLYAEYAFASDLMKLVTDHCEDPIEYVGKYYSYHWGYFTKVYGDICFGTIPKELQSLIHYPHLWPDRVWTVTTGTSYHSAWYCYTLLRTDDSKIHKLSLDEAVAAGYSPCSKCVSPDATQ